MKANKIRTLWIMFMSAIYTLNTCGQSIIMSYPGKNTRPWVDKKILHWAHRVLRLVRAKVVIVNPHHVKPSAEHATIIMCNHSSLYDIPISLYAFPNASIRMLAKKEISRIPCIGKGMTAAEFPFVDRKNRSKAIEDLQAVRELLLSGIVMWIAPEGTRSKDGKLGAFKKGGFITAIETGATIIPIGIRNANKILPARTLALNLDQTTEVHIGDAIEASEYTTSNKEELIARVHVEMKRLIGEKENTSQT